MRCAHPQHLRGRRRDPSACHRTRPAGAAELNWTVRPYRPCDAVTLSAIYRAAVQGIGSRYYSSQQIEVWAARTPSPERIAALYSDGRTALVAVDATDAPVAFSDVEADGHIHFLYCAPQAAGTGVAAALYESLEQTAQERGMVRLYAEASEAARGFFVRKGFTVLARRHFEFDGVAMHNYAVEKRLRIAESSDATTADGLTGHSRPSA